METNKKFAFLEECHIIKSETFNNSNHIPKDLKEKYLHTDTDESWNSYLQYKFMYLRGANKINPPDIIDLLPDLISIVRKDRKKSSNTQEFDKFIDTFTKLAKSEKKEYFLQFIGDWEKNRSKEEIVFFLRYSQLGKNVIYSNYYSKDISECDAWCKEMEQIMIIIAEKANEGEWRDKLNECYKNIEKTRLNILNDWYMTNISLRAVRTIFTSMDDIMKCEYYIHEKLISIINEQGKDIYPIICENFLTVVSLDLIKNLYPTFNKDHIIKQFLYKIRERFNCEVCDYVDAEEDGSRIEWGTATVEPSDYSEEFMKKSDKDKLSEIQSRESYKKGEGISGTILLYNFNDVECLSKHIGSNDVLNDPRQSVEHKHAYEKDIYPNVLKSTGKINNFWMFPITHNQKLIGAFRVVNRLNSNMELKVDGWNYFERLELILIARWFSQFLESADTLLIHKDDFISILSWGRNVDQLIKDMSLDWIKRDFIQSILNFFARIINIKEEKRTVGASVIITNDIFKEPDTYPFVNLLPDQIKSPYTDIIPLLDAINPLEGAYVFGEKGKFKRLVHLKTKLYSGYEAIQEITNTINHIAIVLPRDTRSILLFQNGERVAELYQAERTGVWRYRNILKIKKLLYENIKFNKNNTILIEKVLKIALLLSQRRHGGILILGNVPADLFRLDTKCHAFNDKVNDISIEKIDLPILLEFAKMDGAVIIDLNGHLIKVNTFITPKNIENYLFKLNRCHYESLANGKISKDLVKAFKAKGHNVSETDILSGDTKTFEIIGEKRYVIRDTSIELNVIEDIGHPVALKGRGGRHQACEKTCRLAPDSLGIVISENGGISIVKGDKALIKGDEEDNANTPSNYNVGT